MAAGKMSFSDVGLVILRLAGVGLVIHGWPKVMAGIDHAGGEPWKFVQGVAALGFPVPLFFAWAAAISELVGGAMVTLGIYTRISAFFCAFTMGVAAFVRHADDPFDVKEKALLYLVATLTLVFTGGGRGTLDSFWRKG